MPINVDIKIPEDVSRGALTVLKQLVNPAGELADLLTDGIGIASDRVRIYRMVSFARALNRAGEIAGDRGIQLKELPVKFMVRYAESASLEEEDSPLVENWANLLVSASKSHDDEHDHFVRILADISPADAQLLKQLFEGADHAKILTSWGVGGVPLRDELRARVQQLFGNSGALSHETFTRFRRQTSDYLAPFGAQIVFAFADDLGDNGGFGLDEQVERYVTNVLRLGLVSLDEHREVSIGGNIMGQVRFFQLTEFGFNFVATCEGRDVVAELTEKYGQPG